MDTGRWLNNKDVTYLQYRENAFVQFVLVVWLQLVITFPLTILRNKRHVVLQGLGI